MDLPCSAIYIMQLKDKAKSGSLYAYNTYNMKLYYVYGLLHVPFVWRWGSCKSIKVWNIANACRERSVQRVAAMLQQQHVTNNIEVLLQRHVHCLCQLPPMARPTPTTSRVIQTNKLTLHFHTTLASMQRLPPLLHLSIHFPLLSSVFYN